MSNTESTSGCSSDNCKPQSSKPAHNRRPAKGYVPYRVSGMDCADEIAALRRAFAEVTDPESLRFDLLDGVMEVPDEIAATTVSERVAAAGMQATRIGAEPEETTWWARRGMDVLTTVSGIAVIAAFVLHGILESFSGAVGSEGMAVEEHAAPIFVIALYLVAVAAGLVRVVPKALLAARRLRPDMNLLMTVAVAGAIALGEWFEAGTVGREWGAGRRTDWPRGHGKERGAVQRVGQVVPDAFVGPSVAALRTLSEVRQRYDVDNI